MLKTVRVSEASWRVMKEHSKDLKVWREEFMMGYLRCFLSLRASISGILSRRFNPETNQYQLQCFGFAAILVYQIPRCTDWAMIVQFGFSKMTVCWLLPFNLLG